MLAGSADEGARESVLVQQQQQQPSLTGHRVAANYYADQAGPAAGSQAAGVELPPRGSQKEVSDNRSEVSSTPLTLARNSPGLQCL